eukprot:TRINITY_DN5071_c0_g1_i1.p1 TRINITY_DN5071_c0_g1~~TRINITY_DN5071_c0_g1_i1.p1  ORF type:complete len:453 (+),score=70.91 TRINITY_DN5071_c0_g1_i1:87-1445(+)
MDADGRAVYVSVCGRVERVEVSEMTLEGLQHAVSVQFDIGDQLRFISDEEGEPEVSTDEQLKRLAIQRHTLRVLISDAALSSLEQRMWQLRQLQLGFVQEELARMESTTKALRNEVAQLRQVCDQTSRKNVELAGELLADRQARERSETATSERHDAVLQELRREQRAREAAESAMRKDVEEARQTALRLGAVAERQAQEARSAILEEKESRSKNIEGLLAEWAGSQAEIRQAIEVVRDDAGRARQDVDAHKKNILSESLAREALERTLEMKVRHLTDDLGKVHQSTQATELALQQLHAQNARAHLNERRSTSPSVRVRLASGQVTSVPTAANATVGVSSSISTLPGGASPPTPVGTPTTKAQVTRIASGNAFPTSNGTSAMLPNGARTPPQQPRLTIPIASAQQQHPLSSPQAWQQLGTPSSISQPLRAPIVCSSNTVISAERNPLKGTYR